MCSLRHASFNACATSVCARPKGGGGWGCLSVSEEGMEQGQLKRTRTCLAICSFHIITSLVSSVASRHVRNCRKCLRDGRGSGGG